MREIRLRLKLSVAEFAELLGLEKSTYQGYESRRRKTPPDMILKAQEAERLNTKFFKELPKRIDKALGGRGVPNVARNVPWE